MRFLTAVALTLCISASTGAADAAIYQWQDDKGVIHFTDDSDRIPQRYESRTKEAAGTPARAEKPQAAETAVLPPERPVNVPAADPAANMEPVDRRVRELELLRLTLPEKKKELAKLRRKWVIAKGRTPSRKEVERFEKKRAKGEATVEDNPYINRNPLATPGPARVAYYQKLEEVKRVEERIRVLEGELGL